MWRATVLRGLAGLAADISIHALRVEGDRFRQIVVLHISYFYPRPPCGGRRSTFPNIGYALAFLSTPSVWRATLHSVLADRQNLDFYPRPPCGGRPNAPVKPGALEDFYPRPPCGGRPSSRTLARMARNFYPRPPCGGRRASSSRFCLLKKFLSTPSVWRATGHQHEFCQLQKISIHALRVEGDGDAGALPKIERYFYPRPPCGGRPAHRCAVLRSC